MILLSVQFLFIIKRKYTRKEDVCNDAQTPDIYLFLVSLAFNYFRSHILDCAYTAIQTQVLMVHGRKPKVRHLDVEVVQLGRIHQDIVKLKVSVHDLLAMHIIQHKKYLLNNLARILLGKTLDFVESLNQVASF